MIKSRLDQIILEWQVQQGRRVTLRELEQETGLSRSFLHQIRNDDFTMIHRDKLQTLCTFFSCTPNDLLWVDHPDETPVSEVTRS